ncbi:MAG: NADH-quinone oxidoreductase subunit A [Bdellovibrionales bacterium]|nr:NADH-quinone oxidoreductase subunit A [Bdellovibrionales bacterium]
MEAFLPIGILFLFAVMLCAGIYVLTNLLGPRIFQKNKLSTYECGVQNPLFETNARLPFKFRFYLVAVIFLLFDVEGAFFLPWALVYRESLQLGANLLIAMLVFSVFIILGLIYVFQNNYLNVD